MLYHMARKKGVLVVPDEDDYVLQAHQISRSSYSMPTLQRRLLHLIMAQVQIRGDGFDLLEMSTGDVVRALQMPDAGDSYTRIRQAVEGLMRVVLQVETAEGWQLFHWVDAARLIKSRDVIQFRVAEELLPYVLEVKELWRILPVADLTRLQGKYAIRIFELVMADRGHAGKGGNPPDCWFTDLEFVNLRIMLGMAPHEYQRTEAFRRMVLDNPIREINAARLGLHIVADYECFRRGRKLLGVRLKVKLTRPGEPRNVTPSAAENEEDALIALNQKLYDSLLADEPEDLFGGELARQGNAYQALLKHPNLVPLPKKRARKATP